MEDDITLIMIAHKMQTLKECDLIFKVENNKIYIEEKDKFFEKLRMG